MGGEYGDGVSTHGKGQDLFEGNETSFNKHVC